MSADPVPRMAITAWEVLLGAHAHKSCLRTSERWIVLCTKDWRLGVVPGTEWLAVAIRLGVSRLPR